jgi:hypothetical protein
MKSSIFITTIIFILFAKVAVAFDFEVECNESIATDQAVSDYFQKYIGKWQGKWEKHKYLSSYPTRVKEHSGSFNYNEQFNIEVLSIKGCKVKFKFHFGHNSKNNILRTEEVMTEEGLYIYWNGLNDNGTYILELIEKQDILDGIFQLNSGQNIASIRMKRINSQTDRINKNNKTITTKTISSVETDQVYSALSQGQWRNVETLTEKLINYDSPAQTNLQGRLRYIYIYAILNQILKKPSTLNNFIQKLNEMQGKLIVQPWHPIKAELKDTNPCFNLICVSSNSSNMLFTAQTNGNGSQILSFEYFDMNYQFDISSYDRENARIGGLVQKIEFNRNLESALNANSLVSWLIRINVSNSFIHFQR